MNPKFLWWLVQQLMGLAKEIPAKNQHPILIVEDDDNDAMMLERYCHKYGATTERASTVKKARELILTKKYRLVLADDHLPDGSGLQLFNDVEPSCPVSIVTGDNEISSRLHSGKNWSIILKGTHGGSLMEAVEDAILKANGVNGHCQPKYVVFSTWLLFGIVLAIGIFWREVARMIIDWWIEANK
jgi:CheY-like chemotaxis protein